MSDVLTPQQRSHCMSRIRGRDTKPEVRLRKALWRLGLRYRLNSKLPGRPDLVFPLYQTAMFVDGCFWHKCPQHAVMPKANRKFWQVKLNANVQRDHGVKRTLSKLGWRVIRVWEHELQKHSEQTANRLYGRIRSKWRRSP